MKKLVVIAIISFMPILGFAQETTTISSVKVEASKEDAAATTKTTSKENTLNSQLRSQLIELNQKKSNDIISIKAYRKSLQIKTKEVKLC